MDATALACVGIFYFVVILVALLALFRKKWKYDDENEDLLAGRNVGFVLGAISLTATFVGGVYVNGTVVNVYEKGVANTYLPMGHMLGLIIGGLFFANQMRRNEHTTMLDPIQKKFGRIMGVVCAIIALLAEVFWCASALVVLGHFTTRLLEVKFEYGVIVSLIVVVGYLMAGGLNSVLCSDIMHLSLLFSSLWLAVPFAMTHSRVDFISSQKSFEWLGGLQANDAVAWFDRLLLLAFGGLSRQVYFQPLLAAKSGTYARVMSLSAALGCLLVAMPATMIGITARSTDWRAVLPMNSTIVEGSGDINDPNQVFMLVLEYLSPFWISVVALCGIFSSVMCFVESSLLSSAAMFTHNIYRTIFRKNSSPKELAYVTRFSILVAGLSAAGVAILTKSIKSYWILCYDFVYVIIFPQLLCSLFFQFVNTFGSVASILVAVFLRLCSGDENFSFPALIKYPFYNNKEETQQFPYRTFIAGVSISTLIICSAIAEWWRPSHKPTPREEITFLSLNEYKTTPLTCETVHSFAKLSHVPDSSSIINTNVEGTGSRNTGNKNERSSIISANNNGGNTEVETNI